MPSSWYWPLPGQYRISPPPPPPPPFPVSNAELVLAVSARQLFGAPSEQNGLMARGIDWSIARIPNGPWRTMEARYTTSLPPSKQHQAHNQQNKPVVRPTNHFKSAPVPAVRQQFTVEGTHYWRRSPEPQVHVQHVYPLLEMFAKHAACKLPLWLCF